MSQPGLFIIDQDKDLLDEFYEIFSDKTEDIEHYLFNLERNPKDQACWHEVLQSINTLKTNASSTGIAPLIEPLSILEEIISEVATNSLPYEEPLCPLLIIVLENLQTMSQQASELGGIDFSFFSHTQEIIRPIAQASKLTFKNNIIEAMTIAECQNNTLNSQKEENYHDSSIELFDDGFSDISEKTNINETSSNNKILQNTEIPQSNTALIDSIHKQHLSMLFELAKLTDNRNKYWKGRTNFISNIAHYMNESQGSPICHNQLQAAIYIHDIGMVNISDNMLFKKEQYTAEERQKLIEHPYAGQAVLSSLSGWNAAEEIVIQHHERPDGNGYPERMKEPNICDGAKIVSICDAFYSLVNKRADRMVRQNVITALSEINNYKDIMFCNFWTNTLNQVIKKDHKTLLNI